MKEITVVITVLLSVLLFVLPKRFFLLPFILAACFVPVDQRIIIAGLNFPVIRILLVVALVRILIHRERRIVKWNVFDKCLAVWALSSAIIYILQWADTNAIVFKCGALFDVFGLYWIFRQHISSWNSVRDLAKFLAFCVLAMTPFVLFEWLTGRNPFVLLGTVVTEERAGQFRCQGSFPISILLGLFWATTLPLFAGMAMITRNKGLYWGAAMASVFIVVASASSTPLGTLIWVLALLCAFKWRRHSLLAWKLFFVTLLGLHFVMKGPVWSLIARANIVESSTGWHRYYLIEQTINHFSEWMLLGTRETQHWGPGLTDVTNQYILEGVRGGVLTLGLFIVMLVVAFRKIGQFFLEPHYRDEQVLVWCLFVSLFGHCISFLGVSYFGQIIMLWYLVLAIVGFVVDSKKPAIKHAYTTADASNRGMAK
jgi:hypothetical protein